MTNWIPTFWATRPTDNQMVCVTLELLQYPTAPRETSVAFYHGRGWDRFVQVVGGPFNGYRVVAWKPLPTPYQGEE